MKKEVQLLVLKQLAIHMSKTNHQPWLFITYYTESLTQKMIQKTKKKVKVDNF